MTKLDTLIHDAMVVITKNNGPATWKSYLHDMEWMTFQHNTMTMILPVNIDYMLIDDMYLGAGSFRSLVTATVPATSYKIAKGVVCITIPEEWRAQHHYRPQYLLCALSDIELRKHEPS